MHPLDPSTQLRVSGIKVGRTGCASSHPSILQRRTFSLASASAYPPQADIPSAMLHRRTFSRVSDPSQGEHESRPYGGGREWTPAPTTPRRMDSRLGASSTGSGAGMTEGGGVGGSGSLGLGMSWWGERRGYFWRTSQIGVTLSRWGNIPLGF